MAGMCKTMSIETGTEGRGRTTPCPRQLPDDILRNILSRLPVKFLLQFKSVCTQWCRWISDPQFAKLHIRQYENESKRVLLSTKPLQSMDYEAYEAGDGKARLELDYPVAMKKPPRRAITLVGSCNGLVCLLVDNVDFILWNPSTRESRELANPSSRVDRRFLFGLGFDVSTDDYKLVQIARCHADDNGSDKVEVLTMKNNVWRRIQDLQSGLHLNRYGIFLNGQLHWLGQIASTAHRNSEVIVSFDLAVEKFHKVVPLADLVEKTVSHPVLGISENCLCLFCHFCEGGKTFYEGWIMKENDIYKSPWTRLFSVGVDHLPKWRRWRRELCYTKTGKVLIDYDGMELVMYDPNERTSQFLTTLLDWGAFHSVMYIESLVSPNYDKVV